MPGCSGDSAAGALWVNGPAWGSGRSPAAAWVALSATATISGAGAPVSWGPSLTAATGAAVSAAAAAFARVLGRRAGRAGRGAGVAVASSATGTGAGAGTSVAAGTTTWGSATVASTGAGVATRFLALESGAGLAVELSPSWRTGGAATSCTGASATGGATMSSTGAGVASAAASVATGLLGSARPATAFFDGRLRAGLDSTSPASTTTLALRLRAGGVCATTSSANSRTSVMVAVVSFQPDVLPDVLQHAACSPNARSCRCRYLPHRHGYRRSCSQLALHCVSHTRGLGRPHSQR